MKATKEQPELPGEARVDMYLDTQKTPMTINGDLEVIKDLYEQHKKEVAYVPTGKLVMTAVQAPQPAVRTEQLQTLPLYGREASRASIKARLFDLRFGTDVYKQLVERRRQERVLGMQMELGIISTNRCAKHEKLLSKV